MSLKSFNVLNKFRSPKTLFKGWPVKKSISSIVFYLFKDGVRFFVLLLVIDLVFGFYIFDRFVLPVINQSSISDSPTMISKKVKIKKELYNELLKTVNNLPL